MKQFTRTETIIQEVGERFKRQVVIKRYRTEDGKTHEFTTFGRENAHHGGVVAVTKEKKVVVTHQFRASVERWLYELPGGGFYDGEDFKQAAMRELKEETGYTCDNVEYLGASIRDAYINGTWHYYLATDCVLSESGTERDEEENDQGAEVLLISIDDFIRNAKESRMSDPHAVLMAYERLMELKQEGAK